MIPTRVQTWHDNALLTGDFKYICACNSLDEIEFMRTFSTCKITSVRYDNKYYAFECLTYDYYDDYRLY